MEQLSHVQAAYWQDLIQATQYALHHNFDGALQICFRLKMQPDLSRVLRVMTNHKIINLTDQRLQPERREMLHEAADLIVGIEEELGAEHRITVFLKDCQQRMKAKVDEEENENVTEPYVVRMTLVPTPKVQDELDGEEDWETADDEEDWETVDKDEDEEEGTGVEDGKGDDEGEEEGGRAGEEEDDGEEEGVGDDVPIIKVDEDIEMSIEGQDTIGR